MASAVKIGAWVAGAALLVVTPLAYLALLLTQDRDASIVTRVSITLIAVVSFALLLGASVAWLAARRWNLARATTLGWLAVGLIFVDVASLGAYQDLGEQNPAVRVPTRTDRRVLASQPGPYRIDSRTQIDSLWQPDTALLYGLEDVNGVANPLVLADFERYWQALGSRSTAAYDMLNVRYVIAKKDVTLDWNKFRLAFDGDPDLNVYENTAYLPRAFVAPEVYFEPDRAKLLQTVTDPAFNPKQTTIVDWPDRPPAPAGGRGTVSDIRTGRNSLSFRVNADAPALVFVSQVWYPGWRVYVDGKYGGEPYRTNYLFQGVLVDAGEHAVELWFEPAAWRVGWLLAALTALALIALAAWAVVDRRRWGWSDGN